MAPSCGTPFIESQAISDSNTVISRNSNVGKACGNRHKMIHYNGVRLQNP